MWVRRSVGLDVLGTVVSESPGAQVNPRKRGRRTCRGVEVFVVVR